VAANVVYQDPRRLGLSEHASLAAWSVIPALAAAACSGVVVARLARRAPFMAASSAALGGAVVGLAAFMATAWWRGGWAAPAPLFASWAFGGAIGFVWAVSREERVREWAAVAAVTATVALVAAQALLRRAG
jgi:hypothetical protein